MASLKDEIKKRYANQTVKREDLVAAIREAADIVTEALPAMDNMRYREEAYGLVLAELLTYEVE